MSQASDLADHIFERLFSDDRLVERYVELLTSHGLGVSLPVRGVIDRIAEGAIARRDPIAARVRARLQSGDPDEILEGVAGMLSSLGPVANALRVEVIRGVLDRFVGRVEGLGELEERVLPRFHPRNYADRHFREVCKKAKLEGHTPKDLRDTYASQLLTAGIQLAYISKQLGHKDVAVTAAHYARWAGGAGYREALIVREGEVPADLLARVEAMADARSHGQLSSDRSG